MYPTKDQANKLDLSAVTPTRRQMITGTAVAFGSMALGSLPVWAAATDEISHTAESIHHERVFKASRQRVYALLTDAKLFQKVVDLSAAISSGMVKSKAPVEVSAQAGGAFALFGGYVTGRQIELVPGERVVQAWRAGSWNPGSYSLASFKLVEEGSGTKIIFDHTGFPVGQAEHLAEGWVGNYWEPMEKVLASK